MKHTGDETSDRQTGIVVSLFIYMVYTTKSPTTGYPCLLHAEQRLTYALAQAHVLSDNIRDSVPEERALGDPCTASGPHTAWDGPLRST